MREKSLHINLFSSTYI